MRSPSYSSRDARLVIPTCIEEGNSFLHKVIKMQGAKRNHASDNVMRVCATVLLSVA